MGNIDDDFEWDFEPDNAGVDAPQFEPKRKQEKSDVPAENVQQKHTKQQVQQKRSADTLPNPDEQLQKPPATKPPDYDANAQSGARVAQGVDVNRRGRTPQEAKKASQQRRAQQPVQQHKQAVQPAQKRQQVQSRQPVKQAQQDSQEVNSRRKEKKGGLGKLVLVAGVLAVIGVAGLVITKAVLKDNPVVVDYAGSGKETLDKLQGSINEFDAEALDEMIGTEDGDSYLAQEWAYVNGVSIREEFIKKVCSLVTFKYPQVQQMTEKGKQVSDSFYDSLMNNGEEFTVTVPDYEALCASLDNDKDFVSQLLYSAGYKPTDYTYNDDMINLMLQYVLDRAEITTKEETISLSVKNGIVEDDAELDKLLFSAQGLRDFCAKFAQISTNWTGTKKETYWGKEEVENPEYKKWYKLFNKYYEQDNGKFKKGVSKWEPWYLRDKNNKFIRDRKGNKIVNYYSVKDKNGKDWIEPDKTIIKKVKKTRDVEDPWEEERAIPYNWIGTYYLANEYDGDYETAFRVGDGTKDAPAGIGTTIITKMRCTDGKYHDVRVALKGYWVGENAIKYTEKFSPKNRGFTTVSPIQLIVYEVQIENLENKTITFEPSEMTLCDDNSNISARTGTVYGFSGKTKIKPHKKVIINDWSSSTELEQKYVCWGKSFSKKYKTVYFKALAGSGGEVPLYSAYKAFTGQSEIDEELKTDGAGVTKDGTGESAGSTAVQTSQP